MRRLARYIAAAVLLGILAVPGHLAAAPMQPKYTLVDLGTFGGPASYIQNGLDGILNNQGTLVGWADIATLDPSPAFCFNQDCFVSHAFSWHKGVMTDLGTLPGGSSSAAFWISGTGLIVGNSLNGKIDPLVSGLPEGRAVLWQQGTITDLGTLEGGHESIAGAANDRGQVVGASNNTIPDPYSFIGDGYRVRAFLWQRGVMQDLGTLGGPDAFANFVNERGQVAGNAYTNTTPNPVTGAPTTDPFLWENGVMHDLGTLGGTSGFPTDLNNQGQVVGVSNLAGDTISHPFLWSRERGMQDLGTLGGENGFTNWINDAGDIAGKADVPGALPQNHDAVLWRHGSMIDLGTLPSDACSNAYSVNASGQVVGTSESRALCLIPTGEHAFLWQKGGPMIDLNTVIAPHPGLELTFAVAINDRGEIAGFGAPPGCALKDVERCGHAYILIPRGLAQSEGLTRAIYASPATVTQSSTSLPHGYTAHPAMIAAFRVRPDHTQLAG